MAFSIIAAITDGGRQRLAEMLIGGHDGNGKAFVIDTFSVGSGGHDVLDPTIALTPDTTATVCPSTVFGPEPVDSATRPTTYCPEFECRLEANEAVAALSNICLLGKVVWPTTDPEYGQRFLFALGNFPLRVKVDTETITFQVSVQL